MSGVTRPRSNATLLSADVEDPRSSPARLSSGRGSSGTGTPTQRVMSTNSLNIERTIDLSGNRYVRIGAIVWGFLLLFFCGF